MFVFIVISIAKGKVIRENHLINVGSQPGIAPTNSYYLLIVDRTWDLAVSRQVQVQVLHPVLPLQRHWDFLFYFCFSPIILFFSSLHSCSFHQIYSYMDIYISSSFFSTHSSPRKLSTCSADINLLYIFLLF